MARLATSHAAIAGLRPSTPEPLPFAPSLEIRAFVLQRQRGNLLIYSTRGLDAAVIEADGGVSRWYLNHRHEASFAPATAPAPLFVHQLERDAVAARLHVRGTFSRRHALDEDFEVIPTPGHTPGATSFLWDSGEHRLLFTGDTIFLRGGEWDVAMLPGCDRAQYLDTLELIAGLDFDVLVPWAASVGGHFYSFTTSSETRRRIDGLLDRLWR